jgi:spermidine/putrescine transport system ATP-binding protein
VVGSLLITQTKISLTSIVTADHETNESAAADEPGPAVAVEAIRLAGIGRRFGEVVALREVDLVVQAGEFFSLLGPSGCGKTTLLRLVAGLDYPDHGQIFIGGENVAAVPPHKRPVNTVFQSYALFPHLDVWQNIAFGLRMKGVSAAEQKVRIPRVMEMVQISELAHRKPAQLSGGQKQRVALARAIVNEPQVLLLDEPLGALDLKLRKQLQLELHDLQRRLGITFLYVTHDQDEALSMSNRIAVMNHGRIEQLGASEEIYEHPRTRFVAQFLGSCNLLDAVVEHRNGVTAQVQTPIGQLNINLNHSERVPSLHDRVTLAIRPERILCGDGGDALGENQVRARIDDQIYSGAETQYLLHGKDWSLRVSALNAGRQQPRFRTGQTIALTLPPSELIVLED